MLKLLSSSIRNYSIILVLLIFLGLGTFGYGYYLVSLNNSPQSTISEMNSQSLEMVWTNYSYVNYTNRSFLPALRDVTLYINLNAVTEELDVYLNLFWINIESHTFYVLLPCPISTPTITGNDTSDSYFTSPIGLNMTNIRSSVLIFTLVPKYNLTYFSEDEVFFRMRALGNIVNDLRGHYELYLPLGQLPNQTVLSEFGKMTQTEPLPPSGYYNIIATLSIPFSDSIQSAYPSFGSLSEPPSEQSVKFIVWNFTSDAIPISLDYENNQEIQGYQNDVFYGGVAIGIGASLLFAAFVEFVRLETFERGDRLTREFTETASQQIFAYDRRERGIRYWGYSLFIIAGLVIVLAYIAYNFDLTSPFFIAYLAISLSYVIFGVQLLITARDENSVRRIILRLENFDSGLEGIRNSIRDLHLQVNQNADWRSRKIQDTLDDIKKELERVKRENPPT